MRSFYTGLDFDNDLIILGVNSGSSDRAKAEIFGHTDNPFYMPPPNPNKKTIPIGLIVFLILFTVFSFALLYFIYEKRRKLQKQKLEQERLKNEEEEEESVNSNEEEGEAEQEEQKEDGPNDIQKSELKKKSKLNYLVQNQSVDSSLDINKSIEEVESLDQDEKHQ